MPLNHRLRSWLAASLILARCSSGPPAADTAAGSRERGVPADGPAAREASQLAELGVGVGDSRSADAAPPVFKWTGPVIWTTTADLSAAWTRVHSRKEPFFSAWLSLKKTADAALSTSFVPYQGADYETYWSTGRAQAISVRQLAVAFLLADTASYGKKAREGLLAWADDSVAHPSPASEQPHAAGLVIGRVISIFADAYALLHASLSAAERTRVEAWFQRMVVPIKKSQQIWVSGSYGSFGPPYLGKQYYNNHLGAQNMGLAAIGYATRDSALISYALSSASNPRNLTTLINGVVLMPGDALYQGDPTLTAGKPAAQAGEIYDRYRAVENKGLHYSHIHLRFLTLTALMAHNNGAAVDYFAYRGAGGENLQLSYNFYAEFLINGRSTARTGYYGGSPVAFDMQALYELAHRVYPTSTKIREVLESRSRAVSDYESFGWAGLLLYGADDIVDAVGRWDFERAGERQGWVPRKSVSMSVAGGMLAVTITGTDPGIESPDQLGLSLARYRYLHLRLRNETTDTGGQVFFRTTTHDSFADSKLGFTLTASDTTLRDYVVDLGSHPNGTGTLVQLRLDPVNTATSGRVTIDSIRLTSSP